MADLGVSLGGTNASKMGASNFFNVSAIEVAEIKKFTAVVFSQGDSDGAEHTLKIDDVELLPSTRPQSNLQAPRIIEAKGYERHIDLRWSDNSEGVKFYKIYRSLNGGTFQPIGIAKPWIDRYADYVGIVGAKAQYKVCAVDYSFSESPLSEVASAQTRPMTDDELLDMVQEANFRYYWEGCEPNSGLARENIPGRSDMIATGASGFGIFATLVGIERGFITREQGVDRFLRITEFLSKADRFHGGFIMSYNGGEIFDCASDTRLFATSLEDTVKPTIYNFAKEHHLTLMTYIGSEVVTENGEDEFVRYSSMRNSMHVHVYLLPLHPPLAFFYRNSNYYVIFCTLTNLSSEMQDIC